MKKYIFIVLSAIAILGTGCSAEKRLCRIIERHPELHYVDTIYKNDTVFLPTETKTAEFKLSDLVAMDSAASAAPAPALIMSTQDSAYISPSIGVETRRAGAAIVAKGDGKFDLQTTAKPDTIVRTDTITVDHFITEYKDRPVTVYRQKDWQAALMWIGILTLAYLLLINIIKIIYKFVKR